jgi:hypothetical protein
MSVENKYFKGTLVDFYWTTWRYIVLYIVTSVRTLTATYNSLVFDGLTTI